MDDFETEHLLNVFSSNKATSNELSETVDDSLSLVKDQKELIDNLLHINEGNDSSQQCLNIPIGNSTLCSEVMLNTIVPPIDDISLLSSPAVSLTEIQTDFNDDIYGTEKTGATPENIKKIDDVTLVSQAQNKFTNQYNNTIYANQQHHEKNIDEAYNQTGMSRSLNTIQTRNNYIGEPEAVIYNTMKKDMNTSNDSKDSKSINGNELKIVEDESSAKQCRAFTIYFGDISLNESASASASAKYKNMVERFQNRHRRGASMSKLECGETANQAINNINETPPQINKRNSKTIASPNNSSATARPSNDSEVNKVKMRPRDRSASGIRDANKRHSWSPRSSTHEPQNNNLLDKKLENQKNFHRVELVQEKILNFNSPIPRKPAKCKLKSNEQMKTPEKNRSNQIMIKDALYINEEIKSLSVPKLSDQFTPKSTAMQMAFDVDLFCPQPPLADKSNLNINDDNVSETATYTLDGDNYTEEQKELMNIDRTSSASSTSLNNTIASRPTNLPINSITKTKLISTVDSDKRGNVLEVNYYHDAPNYRPKTSYLEKLKIQMRGITKSIEKQNPSLLSDSSPEDLGTFTSITTSGVLSKKKSLDTHPKLGRKDSLSKSLIDSSEFVSSQRQEKTQRPYSGGYTDHQKAEYCFNALRNQTDSQILNAIEIPETLEYQTDSSDAIELKTAKSKNDWIQAWARNARARSVSSAIKDNTTTKHHTVSQHLQCESGEDEMSVLTDDGFIYRNKQFDQFRIGDFDYLSDPNVSQLVLSPRPPKSPSKIPSPLHSIGRARASRNRGSLQNILQCDTENDGETDVYLLNTAIAISNFTKNLSRKNSLKSPPSSINSPKSKIPHQFNTNDEHSSPQHQRISNNMEKFQPNNFHKRNLSLDYRTSSSITKTENLMTNSLNEQQLNELKYTRARKNSYDSQMHTVSPARHDLSKTNQRINYSNIDQTRELIKQNKTECRPPLAQNASQQSPIRRSSSFSVKKSIETVNSLNQRSQTVQRPKINVSRNVFTPPAVRHKYNQQNISSKPSIQKSSSSNCFKNMYSDYDDNISYYINDEDDLVDDYCSQEDEYNEKSTEEEINYEQPRQIESTNSNPAMSMARYNKALLMRIERSKQKVAGNSMANGMKPAPGGVIACPNTPELPRRANQSAARLSIRKSVPRDSSLNRLRGEIPNSLASAKKQIIQTANTVNTYPNVKATTGGGDKKVQTKYLDISKYKPVQGANFLRKNESKITLKNDIKRSPINISNRTDSGSISSNKSGKSTAAINNEKREANAIQKEMWKRRATYDPMKAAAEDRRRKEEEKRQATGNSFERTNFPNQKEMM